MIFEIYWFKLLLSNHPNQIKMKASSPEIATQLFVQSEIEKLTTNIRSSRDFPIIYKRLEKLKNLCDKNLFQIEDIHNYFRALKPTFIKNTILGHCLTQPYGYAGDFEVIDNIYSNKTSVISEFKIWDEFVQDMHACRAVRNRKVHFKEIVPVSYTHLTLPTIYSV